MNDAISLSGKSFRFAKILSQNNTQLQKAATIKRSENSPLDRELKKQTDIAKDQFKHLKDQKLFFLVTIEKMVVIERKI